MKAYKEYLDNISVSDTQHRKFVSYAINANSSHKTVGIRRYVPAFVCLAVVLLGVVIVQLMQNHVSTPLNGGSQPGASVLVPGITDQYALILNKATSKLPTDQTQSQGHFGRKLSSVELRAVFPSLADKYTIAATANFQSNGTLINIQANGSVEGFSSYIQVAPGKIKFSYVMEGEVKTSNHLGAAITAGYYNGKDSTIYFAYYELSGINYYVELNGGKAEKQQLPALLHRLIGGGPANLKTLKMQG